MSMKKTFLIVSMVIDHHHYQLLLNITLIIKTMVFKLITYEYNPLGMITHIYENDILIIRYKYDELNRLIREDNKKLNKTYSQNYDSNGNILNRHIHTKKQKTIHFLFSSYLYFVVL